MDRRSGRRHRVALARQPESIKRRDSQLHTQERFRVLKAENPVVERGQDPRPELPELVAPALLRRRRRRFEEGPERGRKENLLGSEDLQLLLDPRPGRFAGELRGQELAGLLTELIEEVGLLRRDMQHRQELEKYEARFARIEQKFNALVRLDSVNGASPEEARKRPEFSKLTPLYPNERLRLEFQGSYNCDLKDFSSAQTALAYTTPCVAWVLRFSHVALSQLGATGKENRLDVVLTLRGLGDLFPFRP